MSSRPLQPQVVRRHRQRRLLVEERRQRIHVVTLEGVDVAGDERALLVVVGIVDVGEREVGVGERGPGPLQRAVDRGDRRVEQRGDLLGLPSQHLTEDQHGSLAGRQVLQGTDERQADRFPGDRDLAGIAVVGQHAAVWDRLDPGRLAVYRAERRPVGDLRSADVHRPGAPLATVEHVEADVGGDAVQPRAQRRAALEAVVGAPGPDHRLLGRVLGLERRAHHPVAVGGQLPPVRLELCQVVVGRRRGDLGHRAPTYAPRRSRVRAAFRVRA